MTTPPSAQLLALARSRVLAATEVVCEKGIFDDATPTITKFGGQPYSPHGAVWPKCGTCAKSLTFVFQWNCNELVHGEKSDELYQFFYCFDCGSWGEVPADVVGAWMVRRHEHPRNEKHILIVDPSDESYFVVPCRVSLRECKSRPQWDEADAELTSSCLDELGRPSFEMMNQAFSEIGMPEYTFKTRIGGYPFWVQGKDTLDCGLCKSRMLLVAQIQSEEYAGTEWDDGGSVYLFQCRQHPDQMSMTLQCY